MAPSRSPTAAQTLRFVAYTRTSTPQPLGLAVQRDTIARFAESIAGAELIAWFEECRCASPTARGLPKYQPALADALACCREHRATLLVARLDRLTRSTALLAALLEDRTPLCVAEMPYATPLMLQIHAALAEEQRRWFSRRIKAGKAAAKAAGRPLNPHAKALGATSRAKARARAETVRRTMERIRRGRPMTIGEVTVALNESGVWPPGDSPKWTKPVTRTAWLRLGHRQWHSKRFPGAPPNTKKPGARRMQSIAHAEALRSVVAQYQAEGACTSKMIAARLRADGHLTVTSRPFRTRMAYRLVRRLTGKPV
jgi:DNA invertase Pin-like site-specific DNA recombinase